MPRFYVKNNENKWNVFSTIVDDFIYEDFIGFKDLKKYIVGETISDRQKELDTLLTDKPKLNIMSYEEAISRIRDMKEEGGNLNGK